MAREFLNRHSPAAASTYMTQLESFKQALEHDHFFEEVGVSESSWLVLLS